METFISNLGKDWRVKALIIWNNERKIWIGILHLFQISFQFTEQVYTEPVYCTSEQVYTKPVYCKSVHKTG